MERAKPIPVALPVAYPVAAESGPLATWPRCAQIALAVLVALGIGYLLGRSITADSAPRLAQNDADVADRDAPRLDLNRATRAELALLRGLGPARAQAIADYRRLHGRFQTIDELRRVPGIGPKTLDRVRGSLFVAAADPTDDAPMPAADATTARPARTPTAKSKKAASLVGRIDINRADAAGLRMLPGVGVKTSQRILDERALRGPFKTVDDLRRVPGIGPKTLEKLRPYVVVDAPVAVAGSRPGAGE